MYGIELVVNVIDLELEEVWFPYVIEIKLSINLIHNLLLLFIYLFLTPKNYQLSFFLSFFFFN